MFFVTVWLIVLTLPATVEVFRLTVNPRSSARWIVKLASGSVAGAGGGVYAQFSAADEALKLLTVNQSKLEGLINSLNKS